MKVNYNISSCTNIGIEAIIKNPIINNIRAKVAINEKKATNVKIQDFITVD